MTNVEVVKVSSKKRQTTKTRMEAFKEVCHKWLYIEHDEFIDVLFGAIFANRLDSKPVWLYLVAAPGSGKTEIVQTWDGHKSIYALTTLTPHTLISGKILQSNEVDPSLLPKLDGKVLVIKDFTVILKGRNEDIAAILGQLRDAYDGTSLAAFGTGKAKRYESKFGIVAAVTNEIDRHLRLLSSLGERFLTYRLPPLSEKETMARTLMAAQNKSVKEQEEELKKASHHVLDLEVKPSAISEELRKELVEIANFVAVARTEIVRDRQTKEIKSLPESEVPTRLVKQFVSLAQGIAMARERSEVTPDEIRLVDRVALDSLPPMRLEVLRCLKEAYPNPTRATDIASKLRLSSNVIRLGLTELYVLKMVERTKRDTTAIIPYDWKLTERYGETLGRIGI